MSGNVTFAAAADAEGLVSLQFKVDGNDYGSSITAGSCRAIVRYHQCQRRHAHGAGRRPGSVRRDGRCRRPSTIYVNNSSPAVGGISVYNVTASSATVGWVTATAADSQVEYGTSPSYGSLTSRDWTLVREPRADDAGLAANTTYHFRVYSVGQNGIVSLSGDFIFADASATGSPTPTRRPTPHAARADANADATGSNADADR